MLQMTALRKARGWTATELARQSNLHRAQISLFESRRMVPYPAQLMKIATALGVLADPEDLLAEVNDDDCQAQ